MIASKICPGEAQGGPAGRRPSSQGLPHCYCNYWLVNKHKCGWTPHTQGCYGWTKILVLVFTIMVITCKKGNCGCLIFRWGGHISVWLETINNVLALKGNFMYLLCFVVSCFYFFKPPIVTHIPRVVIDYHINDCTDCIVQSFRNALTK